MFKSKYVKIVDGWVGYKVVNNREIVADCTTLEVAIDFARTYGKEILVHTTAIKAKIK